MAGAVAGAIVGAEGTEVRVQGGAVENMMGDVEHNAVEKMLETEDDVVRVVTTAALKIRGMVMARPQLGLQHESFPKRQRLRDLHGFAQG